MSQQRVIPFLCLATSAPFIAALSVALTLAIAGSAHRVYNAQDFEDCRREGGSVAKCCWSAGGFLNEDATKCMASYLFRGPSQGDDQGKKSDKRAPQQGQGVPIPQLLFSFKGSAWA